MPNDPALSLFTAALGLAPPWKVLDIDFDETAKRIDFRGRLRPGQPLRLPGLWGGTAARP
ncbi:MAG: hypothetical protein U5R48_13560 [Gammaproteobacteria bacterium]|nr:hypothetical protein [Gammaproteobacteria bacterium]